MKVRCWVIVGDQDAVRRGMLLPVEAGPTFLGGVPNAADYEPGQWIVWQSAPGGASVALVCVDIPL